MLNNQLSQRLIPACLAAAAILVAGGVWAQPSPTGSTGSNPTQGNGQTTQVQAPTGTAAPAGQETLDPNRRVCRSQETLGSRLRKRTVCRTAAEWDQLDRQARENGKDLTDRSNINSPQPRMGGG